jgi:hypothetical protein
MFIAWCCCLRREKVQAQSRFSFGTAAMGDLKGDPPTKQVGSKGQLADERQVEREALTRSRLTENFRTETE